MKRVILSILMMALFFAVNANEVVASAKAVEQPAEHHAPVCGKGCIPEQCLPIQRTKKFKVIVQKHCRKVRDSRCTERNRCCKRVRKCFGGFCKTVTKKNAFGKERNLK